MTENVLSRLPKPKVAGSSPVSRSNATARLFDLRICRLRRYPHRERYLHDLILAMGPDRVLTAGHLRRAQRGGPDHGQVIAARRKAPVSQGLGGPVSG